RRAADARRPRLHPGRRPDDPAARERDHHPDLHPAPAGGPHREGARALRPTCRATAGPGSRLRRRRSPGTARADLVTEPTTTPQVAPRRGSPTSPASTSFGDAGIPPSRQQAVQTRRATHPRVQLLTPPGARPIGLTPEVLPASVPPDDRFGPGGRVRLLVAYDAGLRPPPLPPDAPGHELQQLDVADTVAAVLDRLTGPLALRGDGEAVVRRRAERILDWLAGFDGDTWEQRWLASGADTAPRGWVEAAFPQF